MTRDAQAHALLSAWPLLAWLERLKYKCPDPTLANAI